MLPRAVIVESSFASAKTSADELEFSIWIFALPEALAVVVTEDAAGSGEGAFLRFRSQEVIPKTNPPEIIMRARVG